MKKGRIHRLGQHDPILLPVWCVDNQLERMRGLLGYPPLPAGSALLLTDCRCVHTFGMRYSLDLVFMNQKGEVVKRVMHRRPRRMSGGLRACMTLEMPAGGIGETNISLGDRLVWSEE